MNTTREPQAKIYVNVFADNTGKEYAEGFVCHTRKAAIDDAEEFADRYLYTLTDIGRITLEPEFSDSYAEAQARKRDYRLKVLDRVGEAATC